MIKLKPWVRTAGAGLMQLPFRLYQRRNQQRKLVLSLLFVLIFIGIMAPIKNFFHQFHHPPSSPNDDEFLKFRDLTKIRLNVENIGYITTPKRICSLNTQDSAQKKILCVVPSARKHFQARQVIRDTYGSVHNRNGWSISLVFTLGTDEDGPPDIESQLTQEIMTHGDILVGDFRDSYLNITYKHLLGYKYALENCAHSWNYYVKCDDDAILNVYHLIEFLETPHPELSEYYYYYCPIHANKTPIRENGTDAYKYPKSWYTTYEEYPAKIFPDYCAASVYLTTKETIRKIYTTALNSMDHFFRHDDVFVTGIVREIANAQNPNEEIRLLHSRFQYFDYEFKYVQIKTGLLAHGNETVIQNLLGLIVQSRSSEIMCMLWKKLKEIHRVFDLDETTQDEKSDCSRYLKFKWFGWL